MMPEATAVSEELVRLMKTWTRTFGTALTLALFTGCTVTVGNGNGDDTDDIDFSDKSEEPETTEEDVVTTEEPETSSPPETTDDPATSSEQPPMTSEPVPTTTGGETSSSPDETTEPTFNACEPDPEAGSCNACVKTYCEADWEQCCGDADCMAEWTALYSCMVDNPTEDPWYDFDTCAASVSTTGDALDLHPVVQYITACVNAEYMGEPDGMHNEGDGTCTLDCYNWDTLGDP